MKKYLLAFVLFPFFGIAHPSAVSNYYAEINKAELELINSDFAAALKSYHKASGFRPLFGSDLLNAATVAAKMHNAHEVIFFVKKMAELGFDLNNLNQYPDLLVFSTEIKKACTSIHLLSSINMKYRKTLLAMIERDQKFLKTSESRKANRDTIDKIFKENAVTLRKLIENWGFPAEQKVGIGTNHIANLCAVIIIHQSAGNKQVVNFSKDIKSAILKGEYDNRQGSYLIEMSDGRLNLIYNPLSIMRASFDTFFLVKSADGSFIKKDTTWYTKWGIDRLTDSAKKAFNIRRSELFMDSLAESFRKSVYQSAHAEFVLGNRDVGITYNRRRYDEFLHMQNSLSYLD